MYEFFTAFSLILLSEMGDKTQLFVLSSALTNPPLKILIGVAIGTFFSHGLAIILGSIIGNLSESFQIYIKVISYISFIIIGILSLLKKDSEQTNTSPISSSKIILAVAVAIFIGELGDKTQLASISLSMQYPSSTLFLIFGAVSGMIVANSLAIILAMYLNKKIPQAIIAKISSIAFIILGIIGLCSI